jgi:Domain of unknown function (DUF222)/HNH endonuclease
MAANLARSLDDLEHEICELGAHIEAATCTWLLLVAEFDERRGWGVWGARSCAQWLSWRCSLAPGAARERVRVARALKQLLLVREAFSAGELTYCKVRAITRVATPEIEEKLLELARHATGAQLEKLVRGYSGALAATVGQAQRAHERRYLRWSWDEDGSLVLQGRIPADEGAVLIAALEQAECEQPSAEPDFTAEPRGARRADSLVTVARSALALGHAEKQGGDRCEVVVHVDVETLAGDALNERSGIENGPAISPETARRLACDAAVVRIIERDGQPLSVGRRTRTIPAALRRAIRARDDGCRFPGCTHRRFLHAHHVEHWARGGRTELDNLVQLCSYHHRLVHEGGFQVQRAGRRRLRFCGPDGRVVAEVPARARTAGPPLEERHGRRGLHVDSDTVKPLSMGDPLDYGIAVEALLARALAGT